MTEEFSSIYRMHALLPDTVKLYTEDTANANYILARELCTAPSGALVLHNTPEFLTRIQPTSVDGTPSGPSINLIVTDILRDRQNRLPRYNQFRRGVFMRPVESWDEFDVTEDERITMRELYGNDLESVELQVGLHAEKKLPGFAISATAFYIFVVMASRRLEADAYFTSKWSRDTYTDIGLNHVRTSTGLADMIFRHTGYRAAVSSFRVQSI